MKAMVVMLFSLLVFFGVTGIAAASQAGDQSATTHNGGGYASLRTGDPPPGGSDQPTFYCLGPAEGYCGV